MITFAEEDFVVVPSQGLAFGAVAPANDRAAGGGRSDWKILESKDLFDDRSCAGGAWERAYLRAPAGQGAVGR